MKQRLDITLVEQGYFDTRSKAQAAVMAGLVYIDGQLSDKPGTQIKDDAQITVKGDTCPYVGRGGYKLEKALKSFDIDPVDMVCIDIGSSTGGFTDVLLQNGASRVYAVDVGTNQLAWKLRSDPRVAVMEQYNFRYAQPSDYPEKMDFACTDVSFISLKHILPPASLLLKDGAFMVCLIKPQFEAGREDVGRNGIVRDQAVHKRVIEEVSCYAEESGFDSLDLDFSPIKGAKGNIEYLIKLRKKNAGADILRLSAAQIDGAVAAAHSQLQKNEETCR